MSPTTATMNRFSSAARVSTACRANSYPVIPYANSRAAAKSRSRRELPGLVVAGSSIDSILARDSRREHTVRAVPDPAAVLVSLAVALLLVVMLSFALGTQRNIRRGNARLEWLQ